MAISSLSTFPNYNTTPMAHQPFQVSATQMQASFEKTFIDITTNDGDIVTLQRSASQTALTQSSQWQNNDSQGVAFHSQLLETHSFSYTVQGDLSAEELADLGNLFDDLSLIADDFFQGNLDEAMAGALQIGNLGSLSSLNASFSKSEIAVSQLTTSHPYAKAEAAQATRDDNALANQRQAQWQQILAYLEKRNQDLPHLDKKETESIKDHGQEMRARIERFLERHQRLDPLMEKLVAKAIHDRQQANKNNHPGQPPASVPASKDHDLGQTSEGHRRA